MRIRELDGLRALAIIAVLVHHYLLWAPGLVWVAGNAWLGVDLFFILSGFLITSILVDLRSSAAYFRTFYLRRALRIFPAYMIMLAIYFATSLVVQKLGSAGLWLRYIFYYSSLIPIHIPFTAQSAGVWSPVLMGLGVLWSLSVEEVYYTIWAPIVRWIPLRLFPLLLVFLIVLSPAMRSYFNQFDNSLHLFVCRADSMAYGSLIAFLVQWMRAQGKQLKEPWLNGGMLLWGMGTLFFWIKFHVGASPRVFYSLGVSMANIFLAMLVLRVICNAGKNALPERVLRWKVLQSIGKISYTLYLVNYFFRGLMQELCRVQCFSAHLSMAVVTVGGISLSFGASYLMWHGVEKRVLRLKDVFAPTEVRVVA